MSASHPAGVVRDVMVRDLVTIDREQSVAESLRLMSDHRVSALPVVDDRNRCVGLLSTTDVLGLVNDQAEAGIEPDEVVAIASRVLAGNAEAGWAGRKVGELMTRDVVTVRPEDTVLDAARTLVRNRVHRLVVADGDDHALGIVSTLDLLQALSA